MKVLVLDDDPERHDRFYTHFKKLNWKADHVFTASEAILKLSHNQYDIVFLDHDLYPVESTAFHNGSHVAEWIAKNQQPNYKIIVHSLNFWGAQAMLGWLRDFEVKYKPGIWLEKSLNYHCKI